MNEEDMINEIDFCLAGEYITIEHRQAIEGLLASYNQEKENNKKLEEENKYLQDYLEGMEGGLKEQIKEQQKQISELQAEMEE